MKTTVEWNDAKVFTPDYSKPVAVVLDEAARAGLAGRFCLGHFDKMSYCVYVGTHRVGWGEVLRWCEVLKLEAIDSSQPAEAADESFVKKTYPSAELHTYGHELKSTGREVTTYFIGVNAGGKPVHVGCGLTPTLAWADAHHRIKIDNAMESLESYFEQARELIEDGYKYRQEHLHDSQ